MCTLLGEALLNASANHKDISPQGNDSENVPAAPYGVINVLAQTGGA
jgi:hypothetical protein